MPREIEKFSETRTISTTKNNLSTAIINKYVEKTISVDRLKDVLNKQSNGHMEKLNNFTMMFCWNVKNDEYTITIVKEEVPCLHGLRSNQESLEHIIKRVFNQIKINNFEELAVVFVFSLKNIVYRFYMNRLMEMIERKMLGLFFEGDVNYRYSWLPDSVLYPKLDSISRSRAPYSLGFANLSHCLELPTM